MPLIREAVMWQNIYLSICKYFVLSNGVKIIKYNIGGYDMRGYIIIYISIMFLSIIGCSKQIDLDAEQAALLQADKNWAQAAKEGNISVLASYWAEDAVNFFPGQPVARGKEEILELVKQNRSQPGFSLTWQPENAVVSASADLGYTTGTFQLSVQNSEGNPVERSGNYVCIWEKIDGSWKCTVESTIFTNLSE